MAWGEYFDEHTPRGIRSEPSHWSMFLHETEVQFGSTREVVGERVIPLLLWLHGVKGDMCMAGMNGEQRFSGLAGPPTRS